MLPMIQRALFPAMVVLISVFFYPACDPGAPHPTQQAKEYFYRDPRPYTRWWWFASRFTRKDIQVQLDWLKEKGFGGVEIAFIYPVNRDPEADRFEYLDEEWQEMVAYAKIYCDSIGLGCDFTFGTLWPFGGTFVPDEDRTMIFGDPAFKQPLRLSWTHPDTGTVLNHIDKKAFERYARVMGEALGPALAGQKSGIFCDSWEVGTRRIWTRGFDSVFKERFGYDIAPYMPDILERTNAGPRYDYMKLVSDYVLNGFYIPFSETAHRLGAFSRAQCAGAPVDLVTAYASLDVPETEAMLYNPYFSTIVASAAALSGSPLVSAETFTCLYGWPAYNIREEQTADLKLVADALFANCTNHIIWHGTPFNPAGVDTIYFYASVHVGRRGNLSKDLTAFNEYLAKVSDFMRFGRTYSSMAVYLPLEDAWITGEYPPELQLPWSWEAYELRYVHPNDELTGYHPLWISGDYLEKGRVSGNRLYINDLAFNSLYIDVHYMDIAALRKVVKLAKEGLPVCLKSELLQLGFIQNPEFGRLVRELKGLPSVSGNLQAVHPDKPLVTGENLPEFWCRTDGDLAFIFFANPLAADLRYPLSYGQSFQDRDSHREIQVTFNGITTSVTLLFEPYQSLLLKLDNNGQVVFENIAYKPDVPVH